MTTPCLTCGALPTEPCLDAAGRQRQPHWARVEYRTPPPTPTAPDGRRSRATMNDTTATPEESGDPREEITLPPPPDAGMWTAERVAHELMVSDSWVYQAAADGRLPSYVLPGTRIRRFDPAEVRAWARGSRPAP